MAAGNSVTLTFAGETKNLESAFDRVGKSAVGMSRKVEDSSSGFGRAGANVGKFQQGVEAAGRMAIPAAATAAGLLGAAVAPALAAALAGGVVLALGGGVLVAGIASAAKDPAVAAAFTGLKDRAGKLFKDFGQPFVGPLKGAIDLISSKLGGWAALINPLSEKFAPVVTAFAEGLAGLVDNALPGIAAAAEGAVPAFEKIAGFLPTIGTWIGEFVTKMAELFEWGVKNADSIGQFISVLGPIVGVFIAVIAAIKIWIAVQTVLNVVMTLNPIGLIIIAVAALIAIIVIIATKTTWFQRAWSASWKWIQNAAQNVWDWLKQVPGWIGSAFSKIAGFITRPFRAAFNFVADAWNNTIGRLSFTFPGWVPGLGGATISVPNIPKFHTGGTVPGTPGTEMLAMVQAGEEITAAGRSGGATTVVLDIRSGGTQLDDLLVEILSNAVRVRGGNVQTVLGGRNA
jgi:hypothetical protein